MPGPGASRPTALAPVSCKASPHSSTLSTVASTPDLSPRRLSAESSAYELTPQQPSSRKKQAGRRGRWVLLAAGAVGVTGLLARAAPIHRAPHQLAEPESGGPMTPKRLLDQFESTAEYLATAGWHREGSAFAPSSSSTRAPAGWTTSHVPASLSCQGATEVQHIEVYLDDVDPRFLIDVLMSPKHGREWNPGIQRTLFGASFAAANETALAVEIPTLGGGGQKDREDWERAVVGRAAGAWAVAGQVIELPLPAAIRRAVGGARYSADWVLSRVACEVRRGFVLSTGVQAEGLATRVGKAVGQRMCMSAIMVAPHGAAGSVVHWMQHLNPNVPSPIRRVVLKGVAAATQRTIVALADKARAVQESGGPLHLCAGA